MSKSLKSKIEGTAKKIGATSEPEPAQAETPAATSEPEPAQAETPAATGIVLWEMPKEPMAADGWEVRGLPPIVDLGKMPTGARIIGTILKFVPSTKKHIKNPLMYLALASGLQVAFPVTAVIQKAVGEEAVDQAKVVGWDIAIEKTGIAKPSEGRKKGAHLFRILMRAPSPLAPAKK